MHPSTAADVTLRAATADDVDILVAMLAETAAWRPGEDIPTGPELMARPELAHYVTDWPRPGDLGVIATTGTPVGAAWSRCFAADDPGYGFVAPDVPELSIAVDASWRGRSIRRTLLEELCAANRSAGHDRISLSVEPDNPAIGLYRILGFAPEGGTDGAVTMVRRL